MTEYSRMAKGNFTSTGGAQVVNLPFLPDFVEFINYTAMATPTNHWIPQAWWDANMGQGVAAVTIFNATPVLTSGRVQSNGISTFSAATSLQYGPVILLGASGGIAKTSSTALTITTTAAHGLAPGDWVTFQNLYETSTTGMQQIAGIPFEVLTAATTTTFTIGWVGNSSNLTTIDGSATGACGFRKILYPALYVPCCAVPWSIAQSGGVVTVKTTAPHNFVVGQQIVFRIPSVWGANEINEFPNSAVVPANAQSFYVASVARDSFTFNYSGSLTTFTVNQTFASFPGLKFPEVVAIGDVNSGGTAYSGGALYPSPLVYTGYSTTNQSSTINGPAISGAYIVNTSAGFIIGAGNAKVGAASADTSSFLVGNSGDKIYWRAYLHDIQGSALAPE